jgi:YD repeat-containing protein
VTQYQYSALNQLLKSIDPLTGQTSFTYDGNGHLLTVQDANTHTTTYTPNSIDKVGSRKDALLDQETYQYDLNGNPHDGVNAVQELSRRLLQRTCSPAGWTRISHALIGRAQEIF